MNKKPEEEEPGLGSYVVVMVWTAFSIVIALQVINLFGGPTNVKALLVGGILGAILIFVVPLIAFHVFGSRQK
ncbi:hypothetical protein A3F07_03590 [candidate division WWE3 bacterium RIFCSPHIGHO2_12_FULL_38_15]|uniref:DUF5671 domain-containing protein n=1 Tax=candidate division WWE3 bacterium RIFCSPHIGHO2_02_FULL_38_14 TaxID=1802620 RepID=A0A1F4V789_UNCKA|nr:MAG: hypothetical protein A2793_02790 [candidate division WWE3 bacterium RIFCSPHIGHO2_01_FULL_38_45]OGC48881.1 MAG: hypothetical protein A3F07_03590 [candidate division WWE3 bacterium RIFCSPHIGHO2_12_FULL_38_15]OGC53027.1 MAG: hypothetical protein A3D91_01820 [candidate division WWE3 bacterium RIFCSPHIGHO2_02_FULL_38_14]OGC53184.1 MAG: hypothetical protein A3B64_01930 [candidate division WWE3 bacterium RIFCSPLOWO2_01_FULL_37_24]HLB52029.1 hypothetical protein [Patescibacteria group bacterium